MNTVLRIMGIIAIITSIVVGVSTKSFFGCLFWVTGGACIAVILFALDIIIDNQKHISELLQQQSVHTKKLRTAYKTCPKCGYEHEETRKSCPKCGHRERNLTMENKLGS
ncbi:zinc ribbon domain-containing protein [Pontibacillus marinus]|nr:zinc ribbon domain-containing protein [Pontibacillus marinus]